MVHYLSFGCVVGSICPRSYLLKMGESIRTGFCYAKVHWGASPHVEFCSKTDLD